MKSKSFQYLWILLFLEGLVFGVLLSSFAAFPWSRQQIISSSAPKISSPETTVSNKKASARTPHEELLTGYKILHHTLAKEAQLQQLHWFRNMTFRRPSGELQRLMTQIHQTSDERRKGLQRMFRLQPAIMLSEAPVTVMGDAIQARAERQGTKELFFNEATFDLRFVLLQAQATRMVAAVAWSIREKDSQPERRKWLKEVAKEYEGIRNELVVALDNYQVASASPGDKDIAVVLRLDPSLIFHRILRMCKTHAVRRWRVWSKTVGQSIRNRWQRIMKSRIHGPTPKIFVPLSLNDRNTSSHESRTSAGGTIEKDKNLLSIVADDVNVTTSSTSSQEILLTNCEGNTTNQNCSTRVEKIDEFVINSLNNQSQSGRRS